MDTLSRFHEELDDVVRAVTAVAEVAEEAALDRLDWMVIQGDARQLQRPRTVEEALWQRMLQKVWLSYSYRTVSEQLVLYNRWRERTRITEVRSRHSDPHKYVSFPVVRSKR